MCSFQVGKSAIKDIEFDISQKSAATADALIKLNEYKVNAENLKSSHVSRWFMHYEILINYDYVDNLKKSSKFISKIINAFFSFIINW